MFNPLKERISTWAGRHRSAEEEKTELIQRKRIQDLPLLRAAKENDIQLLKELLEDETCDPFQRGAVGETALHLAVQYENLEAVEILLDEAPQLINEPMASSLYKGQTALHMAAVNQNINLVLTLIHRGADVSSPRATGTFFALNNKNLFYFGEHILSFAACVGDTEIVKILLDYGADIQAKDSWGNTVLHILVLQPNKHLSCLMFDFLLSQDCGKTPMDIPNVQGLTPLKLSVVEGNVIMFQHLIQKKRKIHYTFGPVTTMMYDLSEIDSWDDQQSVLELIVSANKSKAHKILNIPPVKELLQKKWNSTGRPYTRFLGLVYILYMICVSVCCANRPLKPRTTNTTDPRDITLLVQKTLQEAYLTYDDHLRLVGEVISVIGALILSMSELLQAYKMGLRHFWSHIFWRDPFNVIRICFALLLLIILAMRLTDTDGEVVPMSVALVLGWCYSMYFARGFQMLGPFTIMIRKIAASDLLKFCWLMAVVVVGYSVALFITFQTVQGQALGSFNNHIMTLISTYCLFSNLLNGPANYSVEAPGMYRPLYGSFCVIAFLLMFNLLIAMMGDSQSAMVKRKEELWKVEMSDATVKMELTFPQCLWFGTKSTEQDLDKRRYISVEERKWNPHHPREVNRSSSDEESDEDSTPQKSQERSPDLYTRQEIRTNINDGSEDSRKVEQHENNVWGEETFQL
ncbi:transient receptor potential cation channel subfamily V member 6-like [Hyla sarda]|uniref:transient receptor potential cation channel subfamily V member 6-like n=1 Tax=Hyla sarda TaxID=327740 RepID=UPI0024C36169|nr:transient receptor potential cation channel subfamily V member 6-like [Hyla sarda]XP_056385271.1 transient receptor potential cation channel subfamily V member 6-like [Hyla sarda]